MNPFCDEEYVKMKTFVCEYSKKFHDNSKVPKEFWVETVVARNEKRVKEGLESFEDIKRGMRSSFFRITISNTSATQESIKHIDDYMKQVGAITLSEAINLKNKRLDGMKVKGKLKNEEEAIFIKNILDASHELQEKKEADELTDLLMAYERQVLANQNKSR